MTTPRLAAAGPGSDPGRTPTTSPPAERAPAAAAAITPDPPPHRTTAPRRASRRPTSKAARASSSLHEAGPQTATCMALPRQRSIDRAPAREERSERVAARYRVQIAERQRGRAAGRLRRAPRSAVSDSGLASAPLAAAASTGVPVRIRLTGTSSFLPDSVRGTARTWWISSGTCRGDSAVRSSRPIRPRSASSSSTPVGQHDEQQQLARRRRRVLQVHDDRVGHLGQALDDRVELAGAQAHAAPVEGGVGPAGDHAGAPLGDGDPVAVPPHARVDVEVRLAVAATRRGRSRSRPACAASAR